MLKEKLENLEIDL